ncbi:MGMT family protein [Alkalimarinus alittae]|uniref:MGMT family protein n=1 Tax=Alkalimarinus alittae TaxID=2961619 RepID=A0ABY6N5Y8_9ALTE|nr:MGMT family protein [Alkalimarinus alittae]UZE97425.1 MGMT family protein [Alkalimarinus alittae]
MPHNPDSDQQLILQTIHAIPCGQVSTYGQVAKLAGLPGKARYVGYVLKTLPQGSSIPWHRVINSQGKLSFPAHTEAYREQKQRLLAEGIVFNDHKISLRKFLWKA